MITEQQVKEWMLARLDESMKITPTGASSFELKADNFDRILDRRVVVRIYNEGPGSCPESASVDGAMESFRQLARHYTPAQIIRRNREKAAQLLAEAEELEATI